MTNDEKHRLFDRLARTLAAKWCKVARHDDLFQEAYMVMLAAETKYAPEKGDASGYFYSVAKNHVSAYVAKSRAPVSGGMRQAQRLRAYHQAEPDATGVDPIATLPHHENPEQLLAQREWVEKYVAAAVYTLRDCDPVGKAMVVEPDGPATVLARDMGMPPRVVQRLAAETREKLATSPELRRLMRLIEDQ